MNKWNRTQLLPDRPGIPPMAKMPDPEIIDVEALARSLEAGEYDCVCVLGPTASGKTKYAVQLAHRLMEIPGTSPRMTEQTSPRMTAEILSADSRQVYRGMDIGTGKDLAEYGDVPYHLIDIAPAGAKFNIYQYQEAFTKAFAVVKSRGVVPIICGGSGLYIESVTRAYKFDKGNGVDPELLPKNTYYIGTLVSREERVRRIDVRLEERLKEGLVEEVENLMKTVPADDLIYYGLEYKFVTEYLLGKYSYDDMVMFLGNAIHQFAKRQMTWFRGMERDGVIIHWVLPNQK
jgi:tRNA dimethylallyltransferase